MSRKNKNKKKPLISVTVGGPAAGTSFVCNPNKNAHIVLLPNNPHYCAAIYAYTTRTLVTGEFIALFSHCIAREK